MRVRFFRAWASNNSGAYILLGRFENAEVAEGAARGLNEMLAAQDAWTEAQGAEASPVRVFADRHGLNSRGDHAWWRAGMRCEVLGTQVLLEGFAAWMPSLFGGWVTKHDGHVETELVLTQKAIVVRAHLSRPEVAGAEPRESEEGVFARITDRANRDPEVVAALAPRRWGEADRAVHRSRATLLFAPRDVTRATRAIRAIAADEGVDLRGFVVSEWIDDRHDPAALMLASPGTFDVLLRDAGATPERVVAAIEDVRAVGTGWAKGVISNEAIKGIGVRPWPRVIAHDVTRAHAETLLAAVLDAGGSAVIEPMRRR